MKTYGSSNFLSLACVNKIYIRPNQEIATIKKKEPLWSQVWYNVKQELNIPVVPSLDQRHQHGHKTNQH